MNKTKIEWVKNPDGSLGYTWNPITGCLNHDNGLCKGGGFPCYAYRLAHGRLKQRYLSNPDYAPAEEISDYFLPQRHIEAGTWFADPFYPRFWPTRLAEMVFEQGRKPKGIFLCDMSDLFGIGIPEEWQHKIFSAIRCNPQHRFYLLTKQPQNLARWSPFPPNVYLGVTATDKFMAGNAINHFYNHRLAKTLFMSFEPLFSWCADKGYPFQDTLSHKDIDWLIIGAQTKPYKLPKIEWVQEIVEAADKAGIRVFLKDNLLELVNYHSPDTQFAFNSEGCYRQEMPEEVKQCKES